jgi:hypothetical protein
MNYRISSRDSAIGSKAVLIRATSQCGSVAGFFRVVHISRTIQPASTIAFRPAALTPALLPRRHVRGSDAGLAMVAGGCGGAATPRH